MLRCPPTVVQGTKRGMDFLHDCDRSVLYSDEGLPFAHEGFGLWEDEAAEFEAWLLRWN